MFRKSYLTFVLLLSAIPLTAQILDPVQWEAKLEKTGRRTYTITVKAVIEKGWHLYSQQEYGDTGPVSTTFSFAESTGNYELDGKTTESEGIAKYDDIFQMNIRYFEHAATFTQKVIMINDKAGEIRGDVFYMVCNDQQCLPPITKEFSVAVPARQKTAVPAENPETPSKPVTERQQELVKSNNATAHKTAASKSSHYKAETDSEVKNVVTTTSTMVPPVRGDRHETKVKDQITSPATGPSPEKVESQHQDKANPGFFSVFFIAFLAGFTALLTPCVFPMIPMTVSFFTKHSKTKARGIRNAVMYGASIIFIYVFLGTVVTYVFGADALNALSTNVGFNLFFFALLVVFATSFLGAFEIMLPNSWANAADRRADQGGIIGILFMALALAIVSFSCTGPIVGTLLVDAAQRGLTAPLIGMFGFSLALALPFMLFAMFPGWMNSLPRSGGWLNTVKVSLGFLELAFAFKFLSNADLVLQLHWLKREVFLAVWIAIFGTLALYLFGKISLPHDSIVSRLSIGRLGLALLTTAFVIYMIPGLWGAPLKLISGFPPPATYSESPYGISSGSEAKNSVTLPLPEGAEYGADHLITFKDYDKGMAYARLQKKPVLLDFTGYACVNCRKMEQKVWPDPQVLNLLKNDIVLISLYVDDKRKLSEKEQYVSKITGHKIKTIGNKWSDFQIRKYNINAQPYYVLVDHDGNNLNTPAAYTPDIATYASWLREGIKAYHAAVTP